MFKSLHRHNGRSSSFWLANTNPQDIVCPSITTTTIQPSYSGLDAIRDFVPQECEQNTPSEAISILDHAAQAFDKDRHPYVACSIPLPHSHGIALRALSDGSVIDAHMDTPYLQDAEENTPNKKVSHILQIESTTRGIGDCVMELQSSDSQNIEINTEHPNPAGGTVPTRSCDLPTPVWGSVESLVTQASSRPYIAPRGLSRLSYFGPRTPLLRALPMEQSLESDTADCTVIADIPRPSEVGWCTRCERQFRSWKDYVQHCSNYHTHPYSEVCKFCAFPIRDKDVGAHERNHQRSSVSCSLCSARFTKIHSLKNHEACYHNNLPRGNGASSVPTLSRLTPHNPMLPSNSISKVSVPAATMESADPSLADGLRRSARIASLKKLVPPTDTV